MSRGRDRSYEESKDENPQIYCGRLPRGLHERDLEDIFMKFGKIRSCILKRGFAFIVSLLNTHSFRNSWTHLLPEMLLKEWTESQLTVKELW